MSLASNNNRDGRDIQTDQNRLERLSKIFNNCFTPDRIIESNFNKNEQLWSNTDADTDREIIASVAKTKYCDNFNITFEDTLLKTLIKETDWATLKAREAVPSDYNHSFMPQLKQEPISNKRMKEMAILLADDLNISEEEAFAKLLAQVGIK